VMVQLFNIPKMELIIKENLLGKFIYVFKMILKYSLVRYLSRALLIFLKMFKYGGPSYHVAICFYKGFFHGGY
jgi:hypothetical protein